MGSDKFYHGKIAFLLKDGLMYVDLGEEFPEESDHIVQMEFFPYGESAEINGYSLVMPTAENLPPLPEG